MYNDIFTLLLLLLAFCARKTGVSVFSLSSQSTLCNNLLSNQSFSVEPSAILPHTKCGADKLSFTASCTVDLDVGNRLLKFQLAMCQVFWCCALMKRECITASLTHSDKLRCYNCSKFIFLSLESVFRKLIRCVRVKVVWKIWPCCQLSFFFLESKDSSAVFLPS